MTVDGILSLITGEAIVAVVVLMGALSAWSGALLLTDGGLAEGGEIYTGEAVPGLYSATTATPEVTLDINTIGWHLTAHVIAAVLFALTIAQRRWVIRNAAR